MSAVSEKLLPERLEGGSEEGSPGTSTPAIDEEELYGLEQPECGESLPGYYVLFLISGR